MELLVTGHAGMSGSRDLYLNEETRKKLLDRYPKSFFVVLGEKESREEELPERIPGVIDSESALEGGVLAALWRLLKRSRLGARFNRREIPILQQTVEICETFGLDPYRMASGGCRVYLADDPGPLFLEAERLDIPCKRIGFTEKGPAIRRTDGASISYLRRPEPQTDGQRN